MSTIIDSKVVEMEFDNKRFEENVNTSISTLDKLKESLNLENAAKGLDKIDKAASNVDFNRMANSLEFLEKRFSTFGIVGMRVIENLTDAAMSFVNNTMGKVLNQIKTGGIKRAMSIENARFQLQGLLGDTAEGMKEVNAVMQNALDSVDGTAYAYDSAALAASQFAASGMKAGDQMYGALRAITGVAAMTNAEYESISKIFTTVAGNGRLMGDQLLQLSRRGLNAAATLATFFNNVNNGSQKATDGVKSTVKALTDGMNVTEGDIRDMVSKGKISFEVFAEAMDSAFGEHAKKANDTLTGAFSNVKAALSRIGAEFIQPLVGQKSTIVEFLNTLRVQINGIKKAIIPMAKVVTSAILHIAQIANVYLKALDLSAPFKKMSESVWEIGRSLLPIEILRKKDIENLGLEKKQLESFGKVLKEVAKENNIDVDKMIGKHETWVDTLDQCWLTADIFRKAMDRLNGVEKETTKETGKSLEEIKKVAKEVIRGDWGNGLERIERLKKAGYDPDVVQKYVNTIHDIAGGVWDLSEANVKATDAEIDRLGILKKMTKEQLKKLGYTDKEIEQIKDLTDESTEAGKAAAELVAGMDDRAFKLKTFMESLKNIGEVIGKVFEAAKYAFGEVFGASNVDLIGDAVLMLFNFTERLNKANKPIVYLLNIFRGVFTVLSLIKTVLSGFIRIVLPPVFTIVEAVGYLLLSIGSSIGKLVNGLGKSERELNLINSVLNPIAEFLGLIADTIAVVIKGVADFIDQSEPVRIILDAILIIIYGIVTGVTSLIKMVRTGIGFIRGKLSGLFDVFGKLGTAASTLFGAIVTTISSLVEQMDFNGILNDLLTIFGKVGTTISEAFDKGSKKLTEFANKIKDLDAEQIKTEVINAFKGIIDYFKSGRFLDDLKGAFDVVLGQLVEFEEKFRERVQKITYGTDKFANGFEDLADKLKKFVQDIDGGTVLSVIGSIVALLTIKGLPKQIDNFLMHLSGIYGVFARVQDVLKAATNALNGFAKVQNAVAFRLKVEALAAILKAMAIVIVAFIALGYLAAKGMINIDVVLDLLIALLGAFGVIIGIVKFTPASTALGAAALMAAMGIMLIALATIVKILVGIDNMGKAMAAMGAAIGLLFAMAVAVKIMTKDVNVKGDWKASLAVLLGFAAAMYVMVLAVAKLTKLNAKYDTVGQAIMEMAFLMALMLGSVMIISTKAKDGKEGILTLLGLAISLLLFIRAIEKLAKMPMEQYKRGLGLLVPLLLIVGIAFVLIKKIGGDSKSAGLMVVSIGAALLLISYALKNMAKLWTKNPSGMILAIGTLIVLFIAIGILLNVIKNQSKDATKAGLMMLAISGALILIAVAIKILSTIKAKDLAAPVAAITILFAAVGFLMGRTKLFLGKKDALLSMVAVIVALTAALAILSLIPAKRLLASTVALSAVLLSLAAMFYVLKGNYMKSVKQAGPTLLFMAAALIMVGATLGILDHFSTDPKRLIPIAGAIAAVLLTLTASLAALTFFKVDEQSALKALKGIAVFGGGLTAIAAIFSVLNDLSGGMVANEMDKWGDMLEKFGSMIGKFFRGIKEGFSGNDAPKKGFIEQLADSLTKLSVPMTALGAILKTLNIDDFKKLGEFAEAVKDLAKAALFDSLATLFGENAVDAASHFSETAPQIAEAIGKFGEKVKEYNIDDATVDSAVKLLDGLAKMSEHIPREGGFLNWFQGAQDIPAFCQHLVSLAKGLRDFYYWIPKGDNKIDYNTVDQATTMLDGLAKMSQHIPNTSFIDAFTKVSNLETFSKNLKNMAIGLVEFYSQLPQGEGKIKKSVVDQATEMLSGLANMSKLVPKTDSPLFGWIIGFTDIPTFCLHLASLAKGLRDFYYWIPKDKDFKKNADSATKMLEGLAEMTKVDIKTDGGLAGMIFGTKSEGISGFAENLKDLGKGISGFVTSLTGDFSSTSKVDTAVEMFKSISALMSDDNYKHEFIASKFQINLINIGEGFQKFAQYCEGLDTYQVDVIRKFIDAIRQTLYQLKYTDDDAVMKLQSVLDQIASLSVDQAAEVIQNAQSGVMESIQDLYSALSDKLKNPPDMSESIAAMVSKISTQVLGSAETMSGVGKELGNKLYSGMKSGMSGSGDSGGMSGVANAVDSAVSAASGKAKQMSAVGSEAMSNLASGVGSKAGLVVSAFGKTMTDSVNRTKASRTQFESAGKYVVQGLERGITNNARIATNAAAALARNAAQKVRDALKIQSPSKVFYEIGDFTVQGFANALVDGTKRVYRDSYELATTAKMGLGSALSKISEAIEDGIDTQPTIRPVVDLANVQSGVDAMNGMFALDPSIGLAGNVGAISSYMMLKPSSATNDDVVSAINSLRRELGPQGDNIVINGITYDDGSNINDAVRALIRAAKVERRA